MKFAIIVLGLIISNAALAADKNTAFGEGICSSLPHKTKEFCISNVDGAKATNPYAVILHACATKGLPESIDKLQYQDSCNLLALTKLEDSNLKASAEIHHNSAACQNGMNRGQYESDDCFKLTEYYIKMNSQMNDAQQGAPQSSNNLTK